MMTMPTTPDAMRRHLMAPPPGGHGMQQADMPMDDMKVRHEAVHRTGADHTHGPDMNTLIRRAAGR